MYQGQIMMSVLLSGWKLNSVNKTSNWLVHDHRKYETALDECESAAEAGEWNKSTHIFYRCVEDLKLHMRIEDEVLYPFFKKEYGDPDGEIADLIKEHNQIVRLLHNVAYVIKASDLDHLKQTLRPLHKALREHNEHEEDIFLRILEKDTLLSRHDEILECLNSMQQKEGMQVWEF